MRCCKHTIRSTARFRPAWPPFCTAGDRKPSYEWMSNWALDILGSDAYHAMHDDTHERPVDRGVASFHLPTGRACQALVPASCVMSYTTGWRKGQPLNFAIPKAVNASGGDLEISALMLYKPP